MHGVWGCATGACNACTVPPVHALSVGVLCWCPHTRTKLVGALLLLLIHALTGGYNAGAPMHAPSWWVLHGHTCTDGVGALPSPPPAPPNSLQVSGCSAAASHSCTEPAGALPPPPPCSGAWRARCPPSSPSPAVRWRGRAPGGCGGARTHLGLPEAAPAAAPGRPAHPVGQSARPAAAAHIFHSPAQILPRPPLGPGK